MNRDRIIREFNSGNVGAFRTIYDGYFAALCVYADRYLDDRDEAADIVQEAFVTLWQKRADFQTEASLRSFLYTAVRNRSLNHLKHKAVLSGKADDIVRTMTEEWEATAAVEAETARRVMELLDRLPRECRTVLRLTVEGLSYKEIAARLGITVSTVRNHRIRAVKKLRALAEENDIEILVMIRPFLCPGCYITKEPTLSCFSREKT